LHVTTSSSWISVFLSLSGTKLIFNKPS